MSDKDATGVSLPDVAPQQDAPPQKKKCDWQKVSKSGSVIAALALITLGVLNLLNIFKLASPLDYILSVYYVLFGLLLFATIFKIKKILIYFGFVYTYFGRCLFDFFLASIVWTDSGAFNYILAIFLALIGILNLVLSFTDKSEHQQFSEELKEDLINSDFQRGMRAASQKK